MGYNKALINITKLSGRAGKSFDIKSVLKYGGAFDRQIEKPTPIHSTCQLNGTEKSNLEREKKKNEKRRIMEQNNETYVVLNPHQDKVLEYTNIDLCICSRMRTAKFC